MLNVATRLQHNQFIQHSSVQRLYIFNSYYSVITDLEWENPWEVK